MMRIFCFLLGFILMVLGFFYIIIYINLPKDNKRSFASEYLTEVISYSFELIAIDKFIKTDYEKDAIVILKNIFYI